jgi:hypothetical protein
MAGLNRAFAQKHLLAVYREHAGNNLRVLVMDNFTAHTNMTFAVIAIWYLLYNGMAASGTKIHEKLRKLTPRSIMHKCLKRSKNN